MWPKRTWFQFSLREWLLAAVAGCAILALVVSQRGSVERTQVYLRFDPVATLNAIGKTNRVQFTLWGSTSGGSGGNPVATRRMHLSLQATPQAIRILMKGLERHLKADLEAEKCKLGGRSRGQLGYMHHFELDYERGKVGGFIGVYAHPMPDDRWGIAIVMHEFHIGS